jgi:hypothetical protein
LGYRAKTEIDGLVYHITRWTNDSHFFKKIVLENTGSSHPVEFVEQVTKFSVADFDQMFMKNNLQLQQVYGDYQLGPYDRERSPRLILLAKKLAG